MEITIGIDVSEHQGKIDWPLVKKAGVKFAFIRATEGSHVDTEYQRNTEGAAMAGIISGAYAYYYAIRDPLEMADLFLETVKPYPHELLPAGDLEQVDQLKRSVRLQRWDSFIDRIDAGVHGKIWQYISSGYWLSYMSRGVWDRYTIAEEMHLMDHPLWQPAYRQGFADQFFPWLNCDIQQYSSNGRIPGILTRVDLNRTWLTCEELKLKGRSTNGK